jgi:hypothetical protein
MVDQPDNQTHDYSYHDGQFWDGATPVQPPEPSPESVQAWEDWRTENELPRDYWETT